MAVRILIAQRRNHAAQEIFDRGLDRYTRGFAANYKVAADDFPAGACDRSYLQPGGALSWAHLSRACMRKKKQRMPSRRRSRLTRLS